MSVSDDVNNVQQFLRRQLEIPDVKFTSLDIFRYGTSVDYVIISISGICALIAGSARILPSVWLWPRSLTVGSAH